MVRGIWLWCLVAITTVLTTAPLTVLVLLVPRWSDLIVHVGRWWSRTLLAAAGARVTVHGRANARSHSPCVFIANHQSIIDVWVMLTLVPPSTRFVAKQELFRIPVFGWFLAASGCVPINRASRTEAIRSLGRAAQRIRDGRSVVLFPEGSRSRDGSLGRFKKGAFHLALQAGVPVVPVAITGSFAVVPPRSLRASPGPVQVFVEPPVDVTPFLPDEHEALAQEVRRAIERRLHGPSPDRPAGAVAHESR